MIGEVGLEGGDYVEEYLLDPFGDCVKLHSGGSAIGPGAVTNEGRNADEVLEGGGEPGPLMCLEHGDRDHAVGAGSQAGDGDRAQAAAGRDIHPLRRVGVEAGEGDFALVF